MVDFGLENSQSFKTEKGMPLFYTHTSKLKKVLLWAEFPPPASRRFWSGNKLNALISWWVKFAIFYFELL